MAEKITYFVDRKHGVRRECGNCLFAAWTRTGNAFRCIRHPKGAAKGTFPACRDWRLGRGYEVVNTDTGEVVRT